MSNPWIEQHAEGEMAFTGDGYSRKMARAAVEGEYEGTEGTERPCTKREIRHYSDGDSLFECSGVAWYKATIGCLKCNTCGALYAIGGEPID